MIIRIFALSALFSICFIPSYVMASQDASASRTEAKWLACETSEDCIFVYTGKTCGGHARPVNKSFAKEMEAAHGEDINACLSTGVRRWYPATCVENICVDVPSSLNKET